MFPWYVQPRALHRLWIDGQRPKFLNDALFGLQELLRFDAAAVIIF